MKRIVIITVIFLFTLVNIAVAEVNQELLGIAETVLMEEGLNIVNKSESSEISREEMVHIISRLICADDEEIMETKIFSGILTPAELQYSFSDWIPEEEMSYTIFKLCVAGIIKGSGNGKFRPDDSCTYAEAITFIVRALGLEPKMMAIYGNDFPISYFEMAKEINLFNELYDENETNIRDEIMCVIFKSLFSKTMERERIYHKLSYITTESPLKNYHKLNVIIGEGKKDKGTFTIDGQLFETDLKLDENFYEGNVICIYKLVEDKKQIKILFTISEEMSNELKWGVNSSVKQFIK